MNEAFLHFAWKYRIFNPQIKTTDGQAVEIIKPGQHNSDAGPDFSNARLKIGTTTWAGNVEIHLKASDWYQHNHQNDEAYANIILHVVFDSDQDIFDKNGNTVPAVELRGMINEDVYKKYFYYTNNKNRIPCETDIRQVNLITMQAWIERLFVARIERKVKQLNTLYAHNRNSLAETFYQILAGNFGFKTNEQPFQFLSRLLPIGILGKHKASLFQIEAMLFGCSGLLNQDFADEYPNQLFQEFKFLQKKYSLTRMESHLWKFLRLRPTNFPTIRIAQLAALVHKSENLFSKIIESESIDDIKLFFNVNASAYWDEHFSFDKSAKKQVKTFGVSAIDNLILNTVVQFLFFYGALKGDNKYRDRAINFMLRLKPEKNHIIKHWSEIGVEAKNAFESQALIELKNSFCKQKQCLQCAIGTRLLRENARY